MNRTIMDKVRVKFSETNLPRELWGEAVLCSAYEINRSPTDANNGETPAYRWYGKNDLSKLRVFGSQAWAVRLPRQNKLERRAQPCIHIGYTGPGYRLWDYEKNEIICSRDVRFNEKQTNYDEIRKKRTENEEKQIIIQMIQEENDLQGGINEIEIEVQDESDTEEDIQQGETESSSSENYEESIPRTETTIRGRPITKPKYLSEYETYMAYCLMSTSKEDPTEYKEAIKDKEWKEAVKKEIDSLEELKTWKETELPDGKRAIQTKWVFRTKEDGTKKARLVAKGFQIKEEDPFQPVYSPVARTSTIRLLLSISLQNDWKIRQLDIPSAFLNGILENEVYILVPEGLESRTPVLRLNRHFMG